MFNGTEMYNFAHLLAIFNVYTKEVYTFACMLLMVHFKRILVIEIQRSLIIKERWMPSYFCRKSTHTDALACASLCNCHIECTQ